MESFRSVMRSPTCYSSRYAHPAVAKRRCISNDNQQRNWWRLRHTRRELGVALSSAMAEEATDEIDGYLVKVRFNARCRYYTPAYACVDKVDRTSNSARCRCA